MPSLDTQTAGPAISGDPRAGDPDSATTAGPPGASESVRHSNPPVDIAGYRIWDCLGSGGMGTVYRAHQLGTKRDVALKVMRADISQVLRSRQLFIQEVRLAAKLVHSNIVRIYDSGIDRDSYYYAMELVEGMTLDRFALSRHKDDSGKTRYTPCLPRRRALALMEQVCRCVHEAHLRGVIHRDLKPANIMVTPDGQPHVLDFGLATAALKERIDETSAVQSSLDPDAPRSPDIGEIETPDVSEPHPDFAGTPAFMSPEQSAGRLGDLDFRTDVYSLGATLFLLLTGRLPRDVSSGGYRTVLRNVAHAPLPAPRKVDPSIDRELEALLLKSLASDRGERYGSAAELADDLGRYLAGKPLRAVRGTAGYVVRKWMGRHRWSVAISTSVVCVMAGLAAYSWFSHSSLRRLERESAEFDKVENQYVTGFNPEVTGYSVGVREALNRQAALAIDTFRENPVLLAQKLNTAGVTLVDRGYCEDGEKWLKKAIALKQSAGEINAETLKMINDLAVAERELGRSANCIALSRHVIAVSKMLNKDHNDPMIPEQELGAGNEMTYALDDQHRFDEALTQATAAYDLSKSLHRNDSNHPDVIRAENTLAFALRDMGKFDEALAHVEHVIKVRIAEKNGLEASYPNTLRSEELHATILAKLGRTDEALKEFTAVMKTSHDSIGASHADRLRFENDRCAILSDMGNLNEAIDALAKALDQSPHVAGVEDLTTIALMENLAADDSTYADYLEGSGQDPPKRFKLRRDSENLWRQVIQARHVPPGTDDPALLTDIKQLASVEHAQGEITDYNAEVRRLQGK